MPDPPAGATRAGIRCTVFKNGNPEKEPGNLAEISEILKEPGKLVWLDVVEPDEKAMAVLQEEFHLHPLAIEDAMTAHERPKIDGYGDYWFLVIYGVSLAGKDVTVHELSVFSGKNYLITVRREPAYPIDEVERRWRTRSETSSRDSGALLFTVLDTIVDGYFDAVESLDEQIGAIENDLLRGGMVGGELPLRIFSLKRDLQRFRRAAVPMRDILNPIIRGDLVLYKNEEIAYFRDVYDHAIRVIDQLDAARDLLNNALEINLSIVANRQNAVVKQLTVIATVFLPLTFITGFFGQNFGFLVSHIGSTSSFWALGIGAQLVTVIVLLLFFKAKRWF
jgi:magnesium transporter